MFCNLFEPRSKRITARKGLERRPTRFVGRDMRSSRFERLESRQVLAAFTPGNLVVYRVGTGAAALSNASTAVFLDEYSPTGTLVQTIAMPTADNSANQTLTASGTAGSEGMVSRSADGRYLVVTGYDLSPGTASVVSSATTTVVRTIGRVAADGSVDTTTTTTSFSGNNIRAALSVDGTGFWAVGSGTGVVYQAFGGTGPGTVVSSTATNLRAADVVSGQLYVSSKSGTNTFRGVNTVGTGAPTTSGQTITRLSGLTDTTNPDAYGFFFADLDGSPGVDTLYVADATQGIQKFALVSGSWTLKNAVTASGITGITGTVSGTTVTLFASAPATVFSFTDSTGFNANLSGTPTSVATAGANTAFRGIAFSPAAASSPSITGAATTAAFSTVYGTPSAAQSFSILGLSLNADLVATAPAGFEVSSDGTTYGSTATFARSGSSASGTLRVRLAANASVSGSYDAQNIVLSSTGATSVNIVTAASGNAVTAKGLTITGLTAQDKNFDGTTTATVTGTPAYSGLANGETFGVTGTVTWAFADATVGTGKTLVRTGSYDAASGNYTVTQPVLTASILATAPTAPTINAITPGSGQLSVAFSPPSSNGGAVVTGYEYSTDGGTSFTAAGTTSSPIVITGLTNGTTYDVQLRAVNSVGSGTASSTVQGTPAVAASPAITVTGLSGTFSTVYGTASAVQSFTVSGAALVGDLTVTAPTGLEVSTSAGSGFADSLALTPASGVVASTTIYVRLKATAAAGAYNSRTITATSSGATAQTVLTDVAGTIVSPKAVTITGLSAASRTYDQTTSVTVTGTPEYVGLANGETFAVSGTVTWAFADKNVGSGKPLVRTGDFQAPSGNYTVTQPTLAAAITAATVTTTGAAAQNRAYNGTTTATITGATLVGVIAGDDVTIATSTGTFASANVGTAIAVAGGLTLGGADGANYAVTQPTGLTADITKASQTIAFGPFGPQVVGSTVTATASSGLAVTYTVSDTSVASVAGASVALNAVGGITVTASQAGDSNYDAATTVSRTFKVIANAATTLAAGDIAVIGYDTGGSPTDNFSILVLKDLGPGTIFYVNDNEVATGGTSFIDVGETEATFTVLSGQVIPAGSVINLPWGNATVTDPRFTWSGHSTGGLGGSNDELFVYTGTSSQALTPTAFIYGVKIGTSTQGAPAGLVEGVTFISPSAARSRYLTAGAVYTGSPADLRTAIGDTFNNWETAATNSGWIASSVWNFSLPAVQAITFDPLASRTYGDAPVQLVATASSGLSVTFVSSDPTIASVSGTTLTILKAGTVTITASQAGDASYEAASSVARSLVVSPKAITVTADAKSKVYGDVDPTFTYQVTGLVGADALSGSLARASGANVGIYAIGQGTLSGAGNYAIAFTGADLTVTAKALTVTASNVNKPFGTTLTGGPGSTSFTSVGLVAGETIGSVTVAYGLGAASGAAVGTYTGSVTVSDATGGTFSPSNYTIGYVAGDIVVSNDPTISIGGSIGAMTTTYGTASAASAFSVSGGFLSGNLTVAAPAGFEVSTTAGSGYGGTITLSPTSGSISATTIYVRLAATTAAGSQSGNVNVSGGGATTQTVAIATSSVAQKGLTIGGLSAANRGYDGSTNGTISGTPTYVGLVNGETFSVTDMITWSFASKTVGAGKPLTASGNYSAPSANYLVTQPTFTADITARALTVTGAAAVNKAYDGTTAATITGASLVGVVAGDTVAIATSGGTFASAGVGTGIAVTAGLVLDGADSGNYALTQPTGLAADIMARGLAIAANNAYKAKGEVLTGGTGSLAFTATGLQNGETIGSVTIAYGPAAGATGTGATVGTYAGQVTISAATGGSFNPANYAMTYQGAAITVLNDLVVERLGDGATVINGNAFGIAVLEVSAGGTAIETIVSPFEGANLLTESGNSTSNGHLNTYAGLIAVPGLNTAIGTTNGTSSVAGLNVKAANVLDGASTTVAGRVTFPTDATIYAGNNFRSVIATGASTFYTTGNGSGTTGGVWYYDGTTFTRVSSTVNNTRNIEIYNGNLYFSTGSGSQGVYQVGTGLPTAAGETATRMIPVVDPYGFAISPSGTTAYVASNTSGLLKFTNSGGVWSQAYVVNATSSRGLYVDFSGPEAVLFATTSAVDPDPANPTNPDLLLGNNKLLRIVDTGAGAAATEILAAGTSYVFRGVDYAPSTVAATPAIGTTGSFAAVVTVAGTASTATTITVAGSNLTGAITATAPTGFEVSSDGTTYGATATFTPASGTVSGTLSLRLAAATAVGSYSGSVSLTSSGATTVAVAVPASTVTSTAVKVTGLFVRGSTWNAGYLGLGEFTTVGSDQLGWGLRDGANQLATSGVNAAQVTWTNVNRLSVRFNQAIATPAAEAVRLVRGNSAGDVTLTPTGVTMLAGNTVAQFAFAAALETGSYLVSMAAGGIFDAAGTTVLDGEWTNSSSTFAAGSGDGTEGGSFDYRFNVVAGDVNANGSITNTDRSVVVTQLFQTVGSSNFRANLDGSATITNTDVGLVSTKLFQVLGSLPNTPVAAAPAVTSPTSAAVTSTTAELGGRLVSTGGSAVTERGVVLVQGSTGTPAVGGPGVIELLASGTSLGIFTVAATNLTASTTYRFRAFARNALGISYSEIRTFTTAASA